MATFIEEVAQQLYAKYGDDISSLTMILPSKRARLFFAESLTKVAMRPVWEPNYTSIDDLMTQLSDLRKADKLRLVAELYKVYKHHIDYRNESFDEFYHWGEILLADFDMIDKYMVNAKQLFTNILDMKELESDLRSYLTEEQIMMINRFWRTLTGEKEGVIDDSQAKSHFLKVWRSLGTVYEEYRLRLRELGVGYTGMIYREAVEKLANGSAQLEDNQKYVVVGFNALSACESELLKCMQNSCRIEFYWDYDNYYIRNEYQEAGMFVRKNLKMFGAAEGVSHDNFKNIASINVMSTSSNVAQCQCVVDILEDIAKRNGGKLDKDTAVVLTDENLLMPLLYALPEKFKVERVEKSGELVEKPIINVTMGYPLRNTLAYSFVERLLALQKNVDTNAEGESTFYHVDVDGLLTHPYIADVSTSQFSDLRDEIIKHRLFHVPQSMISTTPLLQAIFRRVEDWREESDYLLNVIDLVAISDAPGEESAFRAEYLAIISSGISKLKNVIAQCDIELSNSTYRSLVRRHLQGERVPFTGEPLEGLQIMGILETRNLDFKNVILLSMTDNNFPGNRATDKSFLPYGLRFGFNIPTAEHHEGVYAYYFYRLAERAENLYMLYSSAADDKSTGEPSRYIRQLEYETDFKIKRSTVGVKVTLSEDAPISVEKSYEVFDKLLRFTRDKGLSPTAVSTYVKCPLRFYFNVVEMLRPENELEETVDNMTFGNIFHKAADLLYSQVRSDAEPAKRLEELRRSGMVEKCVDAAILMVYFGREKGSMPTLGGELLIIRNIVREYLGSNLLNYDMNDKNSGFVVLATEHELKMPIEIDVRGEKFVVNLAGIADRIDSLKCGQLRIVDYKTGKPHLGFRGVNALFHGEPIVENRISNIINTLLYSMMLWHEKSIDVRPELYYVGAMVRDDYSPLFIETIDRKSRTLTSYLECAEEFEMEVKNTLQEMFDRTIPFEQCDDKSACEHCDYCSICHSSSKK